jgi:hypothetical protein
MEYFFIGLVLGVLGYFSIQWIYNWINKLSSRVESLRWEAHRYTMMQEEWAEFQFWKREQKEKK